jgi:hypothetical protein
MRNTRRRKKHGCCFIFNIFILVVFFAAVVLVLRTVGFSFQVASFIPKISSDNLLTQCDFGTDSGVSGDTIQALKTMEQDYPKVEQILQNSTQYPARLLQSLSHNPELLNFTLDYPKKKGTFNRNIDLSGLYQPGQIPLLMQWDENWGYAAYGSGIIGLDGCGPTCLSMVAIGLTGDTSLTPKAVASFSENNGFLDVKTNSTLWTLMSDGAKQLGLNSKELPLDKNCMLQELSQGHPIICSLRPGDFTTEGHFIVLYAYENNAFLVRDPNSKARSAKTWSYERLKPQIRNLWAFSAQ